MARTVAIPVAEVVEGGTKADFYNDLRKSLELSRRVYNMALSECVAQDSESYQVDGDVPKIQKIAAYSTLVKGKSFASGFTSELSSIVRAAEGKYRSARFDILRGKASLPMIRSAPWPLLNNKSSKRMSVEFKDGLLLVVIRLLGGQYTLRLRSGSNYRRHIAGLSADLGAIGDSRIRMDRKGRAIVEFAFRGRLHERKPVDSERLLSVSSTVDNLLSLHVSGRDFPYVINCDHLLEQMDAKSMQYKRLRQSIKPGSKRAVRRKLAKSSAAFDRKVRSYLHEATARVVGFAVRNRCGRIEYDDTVRSYAKSWRWFEMSEMLKYKCEDRGIEFRSVGVPFKPEGDISKPHVYFRLHSFGGDVLSVKIGETRDGTKRDTTGQTGVEETYLAAVEAPASKRGRVQLEKKWKSEFAGYRIDNNGKAQEVFEAVPVIKSLRERGVIDETLGGSRLTELLCSLGV